MKNSKHLTLALAILVSAPAYSQNEWAGAGSNNTTDPIYRSGRVALGGQGSTAYLLDLASGDFHVNGLTWI